MKIGGVAARLYDAYNRHDPAAVAQLYAKDGTHEDIAQGHPKTGPDEIAAGLGRFFGWFPDAHWEPQAGIVGADGREAVTYLLTATLQAQMGPVAARGQRISLRGVHVLDQRDGLIRRSEDYWDAASFQRQLNNG
jgi:steroid delta-isomerase-like uncharacterized protein